MKSIKKKIIFSTLLLAGVPLIILMIITNIMNYNSAISTVETTMTELAGKSASGVYGDLKSHSNLALACGYIKDLSDTQVDRKEKNEIVSEMADKYGFISGGFIGRDGLTIDKIDCREQKFFYGAMEGETVISEPIVNDGVCTNIVSAPVHKGGDLSGDIIGVVYFQIDGDYINEILRNINVSDNSNAYIIDSDGNTIAHSDSQIVLDGENIESLAAENKSFEDLAKIHEKMRNGEKGFSTYKQDGKLRFIGYSPIEGTDGWSIAITAPIFDFISATIISVIISIVLILITSIVVILSAISLGKSIGDPINACATRLKELANGNLQKNLNIRKSHDEIGVLVESTNELIDNFKHIIGNMDMILGNIADGNLNIDIHENSHYYIGDFQKLLMFSENINTKLNSTMTDINSTASQVYIGSNQVSSVSQQLSSGATQQASSIEELAATISSISEQININADEAYNAITKTSEAEKYLEEANDVMKNLIEAMKRISTSSDETKNIIKTIEDIAFQTNILALNAAVEASRAGEAGKGFAVVADEVRNLAVKSAEAASDTTQLIEETVDAIIQGTDLVSNVAEKLLKVESTAREVSQLNERISSGSKKSADSINQITVGVEQISSVVQNNSATSEQSAAAAEELSNQADTLNNLISFFNLRN